MTSDALVEIDDLHVHFKVKAGLLTRSRNVVRAVDGVSLRVRHGETLGLVGESGCGKSTLGRCILRLVPATAGSVQLDGVSLLDLPSRELKAMRRDMQLIFQDPFAALDPRQTVGNAVRSALDINGVGRRRERKRMVEELFAEVGLRPDHVNRFPHEFSGGQRQRVVIARALALKPRFVVCDEPVSALDVSVQAQILNLLIRLQQSHGLTYLFVSHNIGVIEYMADRIAVMYYGRIVELADRDVLLSEPRHPYTRALLAAVPEPDPATRSHAAPVFGEPPDMSRPVQGCRFRNRCPVAIDRCAVEDPTLREVARGHWSACWLDVAAPGRATGMEQHE